VQESEAALYLQYASQLRVKQDWLFQPGQARLSSLVELVDQYDAFFFDGFGTLYNLKDPHPGAADALQYLRHAGKQIRLLTNAASRPQEKLQAHLQSMGIHFSPHEIISSGTLLEDWNRQHLYSSAYHMGKSDALPFFEKAGISVQFSPIDPLVILTGALPTHIDPREHILSILTRKDAILVVLNPDAWAPNLDGTRIPVSGVAAMELQTLTGCRIAHLGKPFPEIFQKAKNSLNSSKRILMIGDTLGTDIVGARASGLDCALVLGGNSLSAELYADEQLLQTAPDFYLSPHYPLDSTCTS